MKNIFIVYFILFLTSLTFSQVQSENIVGKWRIFVDIEKLIIKLDSVELKTIQQMNPEKLDIIKSNWQKELNEVQFIFNKNGKYKIIQNGKKIVQGIWYLGAELKVLYVQDNTKVYAYNIEFYKQDELILKNEENKEETILRRIK